MYTVAYGQTRKKRRLSFSLLPNVMPFADLAQPISTEPHLRPPGTSANYHTYGFMCGTNGPVQTAETDRVYRDISGYKTRKNGGETTETASRIGAVYSVAVM